ncbi:MAG: BamA/TamA family outer membrane protein [Tannerellaceae bacterium]|jgi:hypothetical protein|nr:BamA/TamA family outer membrane protein [Tannerellaceae bacterium]
MLPTDLYRCIETLHRLYAPYLPANDQAFLYAFFDAAADFARKESPDIGLFLQWWEQKGKNKAIPAPDSHDAIRILTIHKAKGLGFKAVIMPFAQWDIDHHAARPVTLWCHAAHSPFPTLPLIPLRYGKALAATCFANDYFREKLFTYIDNLNTLYVGCTRAQYELILLAPHIKRPTATIASLLNQTLEEPDGNLFEAGQWTNGKACGKFSLLFFIFILFASCSVTSHVPRGQYFLHKVTILPDDPHFTAADLKPYLRQLPEPKLFGIFPRFTHTAAGILDTTLTQQSVVALRQYLIHKGYLHPQVYTSLDTLRKKARLTYHIHPGEAYRIASCRTLLPDPQIDSLAKLHPSLIHPLDPFDRDILNAERQRITSILRQHGYYTFNRDHLTFLADTGGGDLSSEKGVDLLLTDTYSDTTYAPYFIRSLTFQGPHTLRPSVLQRATSIRPHSLYNEREVDQTYATLAVFPAIRNVRIRFEEAPHKDSLLLDCTILTIPQETQSISFEVEGTNSAGDLGVASALTYRHRNLFRGSESLSLTVRGAFESLLHNSPGAITYYEFSTQSALLFPRLLLPFPGQIAVPTSTEVRLAYHTQSRPEYDRSILSAAWNYISIPSSPFAEVRKRHTLRLFDLDYVFLPRISTAFRDSLPQSMQLYNYADLFILSSAYDFSLSGGKGGRIVYREGEGRREDAFSMRGGVEVAGNFLRLFSRMIRAQKDVEGHYLLGKINFSQFAKFDLDVATAVAFDARNSLALHVALGVALPYGNSPLVPFERRYFAGGANSLRGWSVRELGPGSMPLGGIPRNTRFALQVGDIRLDMNVEYRTWLYRRVQLAAFVDAGNVWTIRPYDDQPGGDFSFSRFYKEIAVSYGLGLRFDFNYFLLRFDTGMKAYDPQAAASGKVAILHPDLTSNFAFHLAVGYPF